MAMNVSSTKGRTELMRGCSIQHAAAPLKSSEVSTSAWLMGPSSASSFSICSCTLVCSKLKPLLVSHHQVMMVRTMTRGTPRIIHCPKPMTIPYLSARKALRSAFGGVPISVPMPPMLEA